jgi:hypothetical protein
MNIVLRVDELMMTLPPCLSLMSTKISSDDKRLALLHDIYDRNVYEASITNLQLLLLSS